MESVDLPTNLGIVLMQNKGQLNFIFKHIRYGGIVDLLPMIT